jgi:hypothetical protein
MVSVMAKEAATMGKAGRPAKPMGQGAQVRIAPDLATKARLVAGDKGVAVFDYLNDLLRPQVTKDYAALVRKVSKTEEGGK